MRFKMTRIHDPAAEPQQLNLFEWAGIKDEVKPVVPTGLTKSEYDSLRAVVLAAMRRRYTTSLLELAEKLAEELFGGGFTPGMLRASAEILYEDITGHWPEGSRWGGSRHE
jgi:hypothetical protein